VRFFIGHFGLPEENEIAVKFVDYIVGLIDAIFKLRQLMRIPYGVTANFGIFLLA
jgi:predicted translin family RNA/ssDNA-binding protein